jgi:hypothetical protein
LSQLAAFRSQARFDRFTNQDRTSGIIGSIGRNSTATKKLALYYTRKKIESIERIVVCIQFDERIETSTRQHVIA